MGKEWQRRPAGEQERRDYRYTSVDCPVQPALSAYASTDLLPTSLSQPRRLRFREGGPGHSAFCCSEAAAVRTRLPGSRVSEWQPRRMAGKMALQCGRAGCHWSIQETQRLSDRALAEGWVRLPAKHFHNERVYQSSSLVLDSQLTPGERLHPSVLPAYRHRGLSDMVQISKTMMLFKNKLVCSRFPVKILILASENSFRDLFLSWISVCV